MRALPLTAVAIRLVALVVTLAAFLTACTDAPEPLETAPDAIVGASDRDDASPETPGPRTTGPSVIDPEVGQEPSDAPVNPAAPAPGTRPSPSEGTSAPLPERPPMRAPERETPTTAPTSPRTTAAADAFWRRFQQAVRTRDRAAISRGLADEVRVGDQTFAKGSEQVQAVLQAIVEEESARDAYLAVDGLTHGPNGSTFSTTAHYTIEGEPYEVEVFGRVREVAPGDWRLVEIGSR